MLPVDSTCVDCGGDCYKTCWANEPDLCQGCRDKRQAVKASTDSDAAWALGRELMMPMPPGWFRTQHELTDGPWEVCAQHHEKYKKAAWPVAHDRFAAVGFAPTLTEAHRLCREQAWAKHRKNTEAPNA